MANINKIRISGTSYDIQDKNAAKTVTLTQAEYDALTVKDPNVFYVISDSEYNFDGYWTSAQTNSAITEAVSGKADSSSVYLKSETSGATEISTALNDKLDATAYTPTDLSNYYTTAQTNTKISQAVSGKTNQSDFSGHTANTTVHVTAQDKTNWNNKSDFSGSYNDLTDKPTIPTVPTSNTAFTNDAGYITSSALNGYATTGDVQTATNDMATKTWVGQQGYLTEHQSLSNYYTKSETSGATQISTALASKANTATTYTKTEVDTALGGKADTATTYTKTEVDNAITGATSTKQDTLVSGTNIKTINNESLLGSGNIDIQGGGKAIVGGRGITVTSGETADTVSFNLPISGGGSSNLSVVGGINTSASFNYSFVFGSNLRQNGGSCCALFGDSCKSNGSYAFAGGWLSEAKREGGFAYGLYVFTKNKWEHSVGQYNNSVSASTTFGDSGNTLFSVGNGTADNARHNAFEIRQNGDIYITSGNTDIKLQDHLGGGGGGGVNIVQTTGTSTTDVMSQNAATSNFIYKINLNYMLNGRDTLALQSKGKNLFIPYMTINGEKVLSTNDLSVIETSAITTSVSSSSTDAQVPSAKAVYDIVGNIETLLSQI